MVLYVHGLPRMERILWWSAQTCIICMCIYIHMYAYMYVFMHMHICVYIYMYIYMYVHAHINIHICRECDGKRPIFRAKCLFLPTIIENMLHAILTHIPSDSLHAYETICL